MSTIGLVQVIRAGCQLSSKSPSVKRTPQVVGREEDIALWETEERKTWQPGKQKKGRHSNLETEERKIRHPWKQKKRRHAPRETEERKTCQPVKQKRGRHGTRETEERKTWQPGKQKKGRHSTPGNRRKEDMAFWETEDRKTCPHGKQQRGRHNTYKTAERKIWHTTNSREIDKTTWEAAEKDMVLRK